MGSRVLEPINYKFYDPPKPQKSKGRDKVDEKGNEKGDEKGNEKGDKKGDKKGNKKGEGKGKCLGLKSFVKIHSSYLIIEPVAPILL